MDEEKFSLSSDRDLCDTEVIILIDDHDEEEEK